MTLRTDLRPFTAGTRKNFVCALTAILLTSAAVPAAAQTITSLGSGFDAPQGVALDSSGNIFVADTGNSVVTEILAAGGWTNTVTLGNGLSAPYAAVVDTGSAVLPLTTTICQTNPSNGQCLATPAASVTLDDTAEATPTFSIFLQSSGAIAFAPGTSRIFVRFEDSSGGLQGSTSVAVETN
jgi:hypothetical protein